MGSIVHKKVTEVRAICDDGTVIVVTGPGTIHINDNEIKTEVKGRNVPTRSLSIGMKVETERHDK